MKNWSFSTPKKFVCYCIEVDEQKIVDSLLRGNDTLAKIKADTGACTGTQCKALNPSGKCCSKDILALIKEHAKREEDDTACGSVCCSR